MHAHLCQVPCPVHGDSCTGGILLWARMSQVAAFICTSCPPVPATSMKPSLCLPPPPARLMHELPGKGENQSMGGEDANSSLG